MAALTDAATLSSYLGDRISAFSVTQIALAVSWAIDAIKRHCGLNLEAADYRKWLTSEGKPYLWLPEYPIINVRRVHVETGYAISLTNAATGMVAASVIVADSQLILTIVGGVLAGTEIRNLSEFTTMQRLVDAINALGTGWTAALENEGEPQDIRPIVQAIQDSDTTAYLLQPAGECEVVIPDVRHGSLYYAGNWPLGVNAVFVNWRAGYESIPADLSSIATRLAADFLLTLDRDSGIQSERIGNYSYTLAAGGQNAIKNYLSELLPYRRLNV